MKTLIMIMGYQRSGTNVFLDSLAKDFEVRAINESAESDFFNDWRLRPESQIRKHLMGIEKKVVLKPISEATYRDLADIFSEFEGYDLRVLWIYRDPVNVYYSCVIKWGTGIDEFLSEWCLSNRRLLSALPNYGDRITVLRYEDLVCSRRIFRDLCNHIGVSGRYLFRKDRAEGRRRLSPELVERIDMETSGIVQDLDGRRAFSPRSAGIKFIGS